MYVTYAQYGTLTHGSVPEELFNQLEPVAEAMIHFFTFHNGEIFDLEDGEEANEDVQRAVCAALSPIPSRTQPPV